MATGGADPLDDLQSEHCVKNVPFRDLHKCLLEKELNDRASITDIVKNHPGLFPSKRASAVDWMIDVAWHQDRPRFELFRAVDYLDRYMAKKGTEIDGHGCHALAVTCLFVAEQMSDVVNILDAEFFQRMTRGKVTIEMIDDIGADIMKLLNCQVQLPTVFDFANMFLNRMNCHSDIQNLTYYLCELSLLEPQTYLTFEPSIIATAAMCLAYHTLGTLDHWQSYMLQLTRYNLKTYAMKHCVKALLASYTAANRDQLVYQKYCDPRLGKVARITPPTTLPQHRDNPEVDEKDDIYA